MVLFHPTLIFTVFFVLPGVGAMLHLSSEISRLGGFTISIILLSYAGFLAGYLVFRGFTPQKAQEQAFVLGAVRLTVSRSSIRILVCLILALSMLLLYYFERLGGPPVFMEDVDAARSSMGGSMQFLAMFLKPVMVVGMSILFLGKRLEPVLRRSQVFFLGSSLFIGSVLLLLTGSRGHIAFIILVALIVRAVYKPVANWKIVVAGLGGFLAISLMRFLRQYLIYGESYIESVTSVWRFGDQLVFLYPGYMTFSMNFSVFDRLVETFVYDGYRFQYGYNTLLPFIAPIVPGRQATLGDFQNEVWNTNFDYNLTSTFLGIPFSDFGAVGCVLVCVIFGALVARSRYWFLRGSSPAFAFLYAQLLSFVIFSFYSFPLTGLHSYVYPAVSFLLFHKVMKRHWSPT